MGEKSRQKDNTLKIQCNTNNRSRNASGERAPKKSRIVCGASIKSRTFT